MDITELVLKLLVRCPSCDIVDTAGNIATHLVDEHAWSVEMANMWLRGLEEKVT